MANLIERLPSGAEIEIQMASFEKSHALLQAAKSTEVQLVGEGIIDAIICPAVQPALWACMECCTYNKTRITRSTFEKEESRGDYIVVAMKVFSANILPFFKSLESSSKTESAAETTGNQK